MVAVVLGVIIAVLPLTVVGGLVVGGALALLILAEPMVGLGLMLLAGPWGALEKVALGNSLLDSGQFLFLLTVLSFTGRGILRRRLFLPNTKLNLPFFLFISVGALSLLSTYSLNFGFKELLKWLEMAVVMLLVASGWWLVAGQRHTYRVPLGLILLAGLSQGLIGIWQFGLRGTGPEHFEILGGFYRAYGTFEQPNPFGGYMGFTATLAVGVFVGLVLEKWTKRKTAGSYWQLLTGDWLWTGFVGLCAGVMVLALVLSWSRGAWLGFAAGMGVLVLFLPKRWWLGPALALLAGGLFFGALQADLLPASVNARLVGFVDDVRFGDVRGVDINDANYSVLERLAHWQSAIDMANDRPWLGVGFGNYEPAYADYALINWPYPLGHAHNYYLNILAETGVIGLIAYLVFWGAVLGMSVRLIRQTDWPMRGVVLGLLAAWVTLSAHHLLDKLYVNNLYLHLGAMLGVLVLIDKEMRREGTR